MSDAEKLRAAMDDCQAILAAFVGVPRDLDDGCMNEFDPAKRDYVLVDREECPEILWRAAIMALDLISVGVGFTDPDAPASSESVEAQAAAFLRARGTL